MSDSNFSPTLQELLKQAVEARLCDVHTCLPGIVQKYDPAKQVVAVQPALKKKYADGEVVNLPLLANVPLVFPRSGKAYLHIPVKKGDSVLLLFSERSLDNFRMKGGVVDPEDFRKHHLSDAIAFAGVWPNSSVVPGEATMVDLVNDQARVRLEEGGITRIGRAAGEQDEPAVLGKVLKQYLENLHDKLAAIVDVLIAGDFVMVTSPGNPTGPNAVKTPALQQLKADLNALKSSPVSDGTVLSDVLFTEKGS